MKRTALALVVLIALIAATAASATKCPPKPDHGRPPHGDNPCKKLEKWNPFTHQCVPIPPTPPQGNPPPHGNPPPTTTPPPISTTPPVNTNEPREAFCVQTAQRGETFVQATTTSFSPQGDWFKLWQSEATVVLDGHVVTLLFEGGKGVILAANVPGIGLTCAQPYVSTDGVYANPAYGLR